MTRGQKLPIFRRHSLWTAPSLIEQSSQDYEELKKNIRRSQNFGGLDATNELSIA